MVKLKTFTNEQNKPYILSLFQSLSLYTTYMQCERGLKSERERERDCVRKCFVSVPIQNRFRKREGNSETYSASGKISQPHHLFVGQKDVLPIYFSAQRAVQFGIENVGRVGESAKRKRG